MVSTDRKIFEEGSAVRRRMLEYGALFEELHVVVFSKREHKLSAFNCQLSKNVWIHATNSFAKFFYIPDATKIGKEILKAGGLRLTADSFVITCQDPFETGLVGLYLAKKFKIPLHIQIHTDFLSPYFSSLSILNRLRAAIAKFVLSYADGIRVVSERIKNSLTADSLRSSESGAGGLRLTASPLVLPIYADTEKIKDAPVTIDLRKKYPQFEFIVLMVCRLEREKDLPTALKAFAAFARDKEAGLIIVGQGSQKAKIQKLANSFGIEGRIVFEGYVESPYSCYKTADVFLSTSLYEGFGLSLYEAYLAGLPVVTSAVGWVSASTSNGVDFFVCEQRDTECLLESLETVHKSLRRRADFRYKIELTKEEYLRNFREMLESCRQAHAADFSLSLVHFLFLQPPILIRYIQSGSAAAAVDLSLLYVFTDILGWWYLLSATVAFIFALVVSFLMQKFWTFRNKERSGGVMAFQGSLYVTIALVNLGLNALLMYFFVDVVGLWYLLSQVISAILIAFSSFFVYRHFIFKPALASPESAAKRGFASQK